MANVYAKPMDKTRVRPIYYLIRDSGVTYETAPGDMQRVTLITLDTFVYLLASLVRYQREMSRKYQKNSAIWA